VRDISFPDVDLTPVNQRPRNTLPPIESVADFS